MKRVEREDLMKRLLEKECADGPYFFRDKNLIDYRECSYYVYEDVYGNYIGDDIQSDGDELLDAIIGEQNFDEFMEAFIDEFVDVDDLDKFKEEGLTNEEIAKRILGE